MKILQIVPFFYERSGGPVKVVRSLSKELAKRHQVTVFTTSAVDKNHDFTKAPKKLNVDGYEVLFFPRIPILSEFNISPTMGYAIRKNLKTYDIIHMHSWRQFQDMTIHHYAQKYNIPYVMNTHGSLQRLLSKKKLKWL